LDLARRPIGFFDSGEGGLTVMRAVAELMPGENLLYACDTAHFPYGPRPQSEVRAFFLRFLDFFVQAGCKAVVVACNTATAAALEEARQISPIPVIGTVGPGSRAAARVSSNGRIGVAATQGTCASGVYPREIAKVRPEAQVLQQPCPILVILAEDGVIDSPETRAEVERCLRPLLTFGIDTLVLGCTHFPHMQAVIRDVTGPGVTLVDPGRECALWLRERLRPEGLLNPATSGGTRQFYATGNPDKFAATASRLWPAGGVTSVQKLVLP
jgi:glutamate racemase